MPDTVTLNVRLALRRDAIYMKTEAGMLFRTRKGAFNFTSKYIYSTFQKLLPYLDGSLTGAELLDALPESARNNVATFLETLIKQDILQVADMDGSELLEASVAKAMAGQLEFIRHYADKPYQRFLEFRQKRILLCGSGAAVLAVGTALLRNGLRKLSLSGLSEQSVEALHRESDEMRRLGVPSEVSVLQQIESAQPLDFEIVVYCSEQPDLALVRRLNEGATQYGYYFLPAIIHSGNMVIGPLVDPLQPGCWECAVLRWTENVGGPQATALWRKIALGNSAHDLPLGSEISANIMGNTAGLEIFKLCIGRPNSESRTTVLQQSLATFEASKKALLPHPDCRACLQVHEWRGPEKPAREQTAPRNDGVPVPEESIAAWMPYFDQEYGAFQRFNDDDIDQIPLRISVLEFAPPLSDRPGISRRMSSIGVSVENSDAARIQALQKAIRFRAAEFAPSSLWRRAPSAPSGEALPAHSLEIWLGAPLLQRETTQCFDFSDLRSGNKVAVPVVAVHPDFDLHRRFDSHTAGIGIGLNETDSLRDAVCSLMEQVTVSRLAEESLPVWRWNATPDRQAHTTAYLLSTAAHFGRDDFQIVFASPVAGIYSALLLDANQSIAHAGKLTIATRFSLTQAVDAVLAERIARDQMAHCKRAWHDVPIRRGLYSEAEFRLRILPEPPARQGESELDLSSFAHVLAAANKGILWSDITPPEVEMTHTFRIVKALLYATDRTQTRL